MSNIGFLPCFSRYCHRKFPIREIYEKPSYVQKVKNLVAALLDSPDHISLRNNIGRYDIQPIRPDRKDSKAILNMCRHDDCSVVFRIDYGDNPFRIVLGLTNSGLDRNAYIFLIDTKHVHFR